MMRVRCCRQRQRQLQPQGSALGYLLLMVCLVGGAAFTFTPCPARRANPNPAITTQAAVAAERPGCALGSDASRELPCDSSASRSTSRRRGSTLGMATSGGSARANSAGIDWPLWFVLPIAPYTKRATLQTEVVPGKVWTFDQLQGILYVFVPTRMTVIKLEEGGLLVYAPLAATKQCIDMVKALEEEHGAVKYIVLPTLGLEHKVFAGPFAQRFPKASVYVMPGQYAFPLNLPTQWLGFGAREVKDIPRAVEDAPWASEFDHAVLGPFPSKNKIGAFGETAFFHKATKTLLVTDVVVKVDKEVPGILEADPRSLLFHARDDGSEKVEDTPAVREKGWRRIVQFGLFFQPSAIDVLDLGEAYKEADKSPMKELGWGGFFPFKWSRDDVPSFNALQGGLLVAPILQKLILNRAPEATLEWADQVAGWAFQRIIPCHLANDIQSNGREFRQAFGFLEEGEPAASEGRKEQTSNPFSLANLFAPKAPKKSGGAGSSREVMPLEDDFAILNQADAELTKAGTLFPPSAKVRRGGRAGQSKGASQ